MLGRLIEILGPDIGALKTAHLRTHELILRTRGQ